MTEQTSALQLPGPLSPDVAQALRSRLKAVVDEWVDTIRQMIPPLSDASFEEACDHVPTILTQIAAAVEAKSPSDLQRLLAFAPAQGETRFRQRYDMRQLMTEDRLLRQVIVRHTAEALGRPMTLPEQTGLHWAVDIMLQQAVLAFADEHDTQMKAAAEAEMHYATFLAHDLRNNLSAVTLHLQLLRLNLAGMPGVEEHLETLDTAQQAILTTVGGMTRLLLAERNRLTQTDRAVKPVVLQPLVDGVVRGMQHEADQKGLKLSVEVEPGMTGETDPELLTLVLQNLLGNAIKYSRTGTIRLAAHRQQEECVVSVIDNGPGIAPDRLGRLFEAFSRGETHGQEGLGLGLSIANRAAKQMGATLSVESKLNAGSTFTLRFPCGKA